MDIDYKQNLLFVLQSIQNFNVSLKVIISHLEEKNFTSIPLFDLKNCQGSHVQIISWLKNIEKEGADRRYKSFATKYLRKWKETSKPITDTSSQNTSIETSTLKKSLLKLTTLEREFERDLNMLNMQYQGADYKFIFTTLEGNQVNINNLLNNNKFIEANKYLTCIPENIYSLLNPKSEKDKAFIEILDKLFDKRYKELREQFETGQFYYQDEFKRKISYIIQELAKVKKDFIKE